MRYLVRCCLLLFFAGGTLFLPAQTRTDSSGGYLQLLRELSQAGNFEQAQVEAENFRAYLQRMQFLIPADAIPVLSAIYRHNKDEKSALGFLSDASRDARRDRNPESRARLLGALVTAFNDWKQPEHALACQQLLAATKDTLAERDRRLAMSGIQHRIDSLTELRRIETAEQARYFRLERDRAFLLGGAILLVFLGLVLANIKTVSRWRKRLAKKELENEFLRSDRFTSTFAETLAPVPVAETAVPAYERTGYFTPDNPERDKTALLIEPNRQIVLYLKSLLSDRFKVETAATPTEGLLLASDTLPDLIVCDAVLNGKTGIDIVRQIKLSERTNHIPIILLTERYGNEGKLDALRAGADAWFNRPVLNKDFDVEVSRLLDARKGKHEHFARFLHLYFSENRITLDDPFLTRSVEVVDQNLSDPDFMADELARKMQMNRQHYSKKLHVLTGKEPLQLIREMRLEKAKVLLEKRAGTPRAIAELVGFSSAGTFALAFKEYFGENTLLLQGEGKRT